MADPHDANRGAATKLTPQEVTDLAPMVEIEWRAAWDAGHPPRLDQVARDVAELPRAFLVELLLFDQKRRWSQGDKVPVEQYVKLVPILAADSQSRVDLISGEVIVRQSLGHAVNWDELVSRFPADEPAIRQQAMVHTDRAGKDPTIAPPQLQKSQDDAATLPPPVGNGQSAIADARDAATLPAAPASPFDMANAETLVGDNLPPTGALPSRFFGNYELLDELGRGGMGVVYRARQRNADRLVALKVIRLDQLHSLSRDTQTTAVDRFRTEAQAAARLNHDNIVTVYEVGEHQGQQFYSMRYVEGQSLAELVRQKPLTCRRAAEILEPVSRAVQDAHSHGILHRDLKPHNILIDAASGRPLVADFGLAKLTQGREELTHAGEVMGTPAYMSPEQACDSAHVTAASDTYSLGATLYCVLTGRPPFQAASAIETLRQVCDAEPAPPRQLNPQIDLDLETICLKCLEKSPPRRYESAAALADDLGRYIRGEPIIARPIGSLDRAWRWCKRNPLEAVLAAIAVSLLLLASVVSTVAYVTTKRALDDSEQSLLAAVGAVNDMLTTVSENDLLNEPGMQPLRRELLDKALARYQVFLERREDDPQLRGEVALANFRVGLINELVGDPQNALPAFETARRIQADLLELTPDEPGPHRDLGDTVNALGNLMRRLNRPDDAAKEYERAIRLRERLVDLDPNEPNYVRMLANSYMNVGLVEKARGELQGNSETHFQAARDAIEKAQKLRRTLLGRYGDEDELKTKRDLGLGYFNLAGLSPMGSDAGRKYIRDAVDHFEQVMAKNSRDLTSEQRLTQTYRIAGDHAAAAKDFEAALDWQRKAGIRVERLASANPSVPEYQYNLATLLMSSGEVQHESAKYDEALDAFKRARVILEKLVEDHAQEPKYRLYLSKALRGIAAAHLKRDEPQLALDTLHVAHPHAKWLMENHPHYPEVPEELDFLDRWIAHLR